MRSAPSARAARRRPKCVGAFGAVSPAPARPARPSSQTGRRWAGWSGAPCRLMGYRRDADLCAWRDRSWSAHARATIEWPAVRVLARGGGGDPGLNLPRTLCLTQRRERDGRVDGLAHQFAERTLLRAARDRLGEHVFGRLGRGSDGTRDVRKATRWMARIWLQTAESARQKLQAILHEPRGAGATHDPPGARDELVGRARARGELVGRARARGELVGARGASASS
jgi:hypothetical protein